MPWQADEAQAFSSSSVLTLGRGLNTKSRIVPTWFSTWPFSQPDAGVQAVGSSVHNYFSQERHLASREIYKQGRSAAPAEWRAVMA